MRWNALTCGAQAIALEAIRRQFMGRTATVSASNDWGPEVDERSVEIELDEAVARRQHYTGGERTGSDDRGVRFYNFTDSDLTVQARGTSVKQHVRKFDPERAVRTALSLPKSKSSAL